MSDTSLKSAVCRQCGKPFDIPELPALVNVADTPSLKERVKDGTLFTAICPACGAVNIAKAKMLYHDPSLRLMIWLLPEESLTEEERLRIEDSIESLWSSVKDSLHDYVFRRVGDVGSLIEKVRIFDAGLEDTVIEMCKFVSGKELDADGLRFRAMAGADNEMEFVFPRGGEMHSVKVGFNVYEDCRAILGRNPSIVPVGPFPEVGPDWTASVFG